MIPGYYYGVPAGGMTTEDGLPIIKPTPYTLEAILIGRAVDGALGELRQRGFGAAMTIPDAELMRMACRHLLRLQEEDRAEEAVQEV